MEVKQHLEIIYNFLLFFLNFIDSSGIHFIVAALWHNFIYFILFQFDFIQLLTQKFP